MQLGYVVIYVNDLLRCHQFWTDQVGMVTLRAKTIEPFTIPQVSFPGHSTAIELVPNALMEQAGHSVVPATPSMCFYTADLHAEHQRLTEANVDVTEISDHFSTLTFAFSDPEGRWFAMMATP